MHKMKTKTQVNFKTLFQKVIVTVYTLYNSIAFWPRKMSLSIFFLNTSLAKIAFPASKMAEQILGKKKKKKDL